MTIFDQAWQFVIGLFGRVMEFCYSISFENYALALLFYAIFFKLLFLPFSIKQRLNTNRTVLIRPQLNAIEQKYAGMTDYESISRKQHEMMALRKKHGISTSMGCLPLLIQIPVIYALYEIIRRPLTFVSHLSDEVLATLASPDFFNLDRGQAYYEMDLLSKLLTTDNAEALRLVEGATLPKLAFWGIDFGAQPDIKAPSLVLLVPLFVFAAQFLATYLMQLWSGRSSKNLPPEVQMSNRIMMTTMPLMTAFLSLNFAAAIGVYWIYQSLLGLLQFFLLMKLMPTPKPHEQSS